MESFCNQYRGEYCLVDDKFIEYDVDEDIPVICSDGKVLFIYPIRAELGIALRKVNGEVIASFSMFEDEDDLLDITNSKILYNISATLNCDDFEKKLITVIKSLVPIFTVFLTGYFFMRTFHHRL
jgi:hypothetical protein